MLRIIVSCIVRKLTSQEMRHAECVGGIIALHSTCEMNNSNDYKLVGPTLLIQTSAFK